MNGPGDIIPFVKGRVALHAILEAAGIGPGDQVLLPGYTCVVVPNAILYRGAEPVFLDVDPATGNLDAGRVAEARGRLWDPDRARVLIVQHTYGLPADADALRDVAARNGLLVVEDACHALGARWRGRQVGELGDAAFFSSQWSKPITTGLGGWARVADPALDARVRAVAAGYAAPGAWASLRLELQYLAYRLLYRPRLAWTVQGLYRTAGRAGLVGGSSSADELVGREPPRYRRRMGRFQERRLHGLLARSAEMVATRRRHAALIEAELRRRGLPTATVPEGADPVWLRYPLPVGNKDELLAEARRRRVELGDWFLSPVHPNTAGWERAGYRAGGCPTAEALSRRIVNLPTHAGLDAEEIARIVAFVADYASAPPPVPV